MTSPIAHRQFHGLKLLLALALSLPMLVQAAEPLPSWNDGPSKMHIIEFVQAGHDQGHKDLRQPRGPYRRVR